VRELEPDAMRGELALIKVGAEQPGQVAAVADMYNAKTVDSSPETATIEVTGARQKIEAAIDTFQPVRDPRDFPDRDDGAGPRHRSDRRVRFDGTARRRGELRRTIHRDSYQ